MGNLPRHPKEGNIFSDGGGGLTNRSDSELKLLKLRAVFVTNLLRWVVGGEIFSIKNPPACLTVGRIDPTSLNVPAQDSRPGYQSNVGSTGNEKLPGKFLKTSLDGKEEGKDWR